MSMSNVCPSCGVAGIRYWHKIAAFCNALAPAQCNRCGAYSVPLEAVQPGVLLSVPEVVAGPVVLVAWLATHDLRLSLQLGLGALVLLFCFKVQRARLVAFVPQNESELKRRRGLAIAIAVAVLACLGIFTLLIPKR